MEKYYLLELEDEDAMLIPVKETFGCVRVQGLNCAFTPISLEPKNKLNTLLGTTEKPRDEEELEDWLQKAGYEVDGYDIGTAGYDSQTLDDYIEKCGKDVLYYDFDEKIFFDLNSLDSEIGYEWHDRSNWQLVTFEDAIELEIDKNSFVNLDEWLGEFSHQSLFDIISIEGTPVNGKKLLEYDSDWAGFHPGGTILTTEEAEEWVENLKKESN